MTPQHATARLPRSGSAAIAAGALIQAALGIEFVLAGLSKIVNANFVTQFQTYVENSPGARAGLIAPIIQALIVPNITVAANLARFTEFGAGIVLLVAAVEV